jgi:hypothetical protein
MKDQKTKTKSASKSTKSPKPSARNATHKTTQEVTPMQTIHSAPIQVGSSAAPAPSIPRAPATPVVNQKPPPAGALIPTPPAGFVPSPSSIFSGVLPRLLELGALPGAVDDLKGFLDYALVLGAYVPPLAEVIAAFELAEAWSTMRKASAIWDAYALLQEGMAWATVRPLMDQLRPAFELATAHNPSLRTRFANLNTLLTAKQAIAKKGIATKALNKKAEAEGKEPTHGKAGKRRKKAADKAIVAAAANAGAPAPAPTASPAPVAAPPAPLASAAGSDVAARS